ncbi:DUF1707 domain-containing protein [Streptomyces sp. GC420]|nr:DUF1707 domain-containing protein [Streptomyces sp. GC420]NBM19180.1 DUF1707 domain-containing protein [Streptomyces sp. GC420]
MRASDADRDRVTDILRDALAEGRLSPEEHSERIDAVYAAKTLAELDPLVRDLPAPGTRAVPGPAAPAPGLAPAPHAYGPAPGTPMTSENLIAVFSASTRKGRWRLSRRTNAFALFGSVEIDLTEAIFEQQHSVIQATSLFGNVEVRVPENITLRGNGAGIFGNWEVDSAEAGDPQAPVVVVTGYSVFGNIEAKAKRGKRVRDLHAGFRDRLGR